MADLSAMNVPVRVYVRWWVKPAVVTLGFTLGRFTLSQEICARIFAFIARNGVRAEVLR